MELTLVEEGGVGAVEGQPGQPFLTNADDINRVIEACFSYGVHAALLYADNLPSAFFDLKSGEAGTVLQKMRNYHMRLAVVYPSGSPELSDRFKELLLDERRGSDFGLFETRAAARAWLAE